MRKGFWLMGFIMTVFFFLAGIILVFSSALSDKIPAPNRDYLALVFFAYSGFRSFRLFKQYRTVFSKTNVE